MRSSDFTAPLFLVADDYFISAIPRSGRTAAPITASGAAVSDVKVIHVDDGDTLVVLTPDRQKLKVRLANIDAPESSHGRCRPGQGRSRR